MINGETVGAVKDRIIRFIKETKKVNLEDHEFLRNGEVLNDKTIINTDKIKTSDKFTIQKKTIQIPQQKNKVSKETGRLVEGFVVENIEPLGNVINETKTGNDAINLTNQNINIPLHSIQTITTINQAPIHKYKPPEGPNKNSPYIGPETKQQIITTNQYPTNCFPKYTYQPTIYLRNNNVINNERQNAKGKTNLTNKSRYPHGQLFLNGQPLVLKNSVTIPVQYPTNIYNPKKYYLCTTSNNRLKNKLKVSYVHPKYNTKNIPIRPNPQYPPITVPKPMVEPLPQSQNTNQINPFNQNIIYTNQSPLNINSNTSVSLPPQVVPVQVPVQSVAPVPVVPMQVITNQPVVIPQPSNFIKPYVRYEAKGLCDLQRKFMMFDRYGHLYSPMPIYTVPLNNGLTMMYTDAQATYEFR